MNPSISSTPGLTLAELVCHLQNLLKDHDGAPGEMLLRTVCDVLYASSLLKEEGRSVRARVIIAPPEAFPPSEGPPDGIHAIRFSTPHNLTENEIKRLSPAASFFHSVVAIWPDRDKGFRIWGILNTGPRWLNLVAGGRKPVGDETPHPIIHVRDPGWMLFYHGYSLLAEWRGREFHGPRMDVFQSKLLRDRFAGHRQRLVEALGTQCLPASMDFDSYAELSHRVSLQFVKRIINLEDAWQVFRNSSDQELDRLEEAFFELARLFSDLMQVDGALVLDKRLGLIGFGGEIRVDRNVLQVGHAHDLEGTMMTAWDVQGDGTRHRSVYRLCSVAPDVIGFVISQDSQVRMIANVDGSVIFWPHTVV